MSLINKHEAKQTFQHLLSYLSKEEDNGSAICKLTLFSDGSGEISSETRFGHLGTSTEFNSLDELILLLSTHKLKSLDQP